MSNTTNSDTAKDSRLSDAFLKLKFCGGVGSTTGANFLLTGQRNDGSKSTDGSNAFRILVDCGLQQGSMDAKEFNASAFPYDPTSVDVLLVTHAHTDHIGRIPKLVRDGFAGEIFSTIETKKLTEIMFEDALKIMTQEAARQQVEPMYKAEDVAKAFKLWKTIDYHKDFVLHDGYSVYLKDAGHVLGSSMFELTVTDIHGTSNWKQPEQGGKAKRKIVFTGDLGNSPAPLLRDTEDITDADYVLMESVYGDRNHEDRTIRLQKLQDAIIDNHKRGGVMMMPLFALEKSQEILYEINEMLEQKKIPVTPMYLDSPLAIKLTKVYKQMTKDFNPEAAKDAQTDDLFDFPGLRVTETSEDSREIAYMPSPKIVMAGSGMSAGGRILHHEANYLGDPKNTILFTGYQAAGTVGRLIRDGAPEVYIHNQPVKVRARIESIDGYSSHKDSDHLVEFVANTAETVRRVFVVMGESRSSLFLVQRLRDYLGVNAYHPNEGEEIELI